MDLILISGVEVYGKEGGQAWGKGVLVILVPSFVEKGCRTNPTGKSEGKKVNKQKRVVDFEDRVVVGKHVTNKWANKGPGTFSRFGGLKWAGSNLKRGRVVW